MMQGDNLSCRVAERRKTLFGNPDWNGMDFLDVSEDQLSLCVHFFGQVPENVSLENVRIQGGRRIRGIEAIEVEIDLANDPELDNCLRITLDRFGDFSTYRLCLVEPTPNPEEPGAKAYRPLSGLDPRYACLDFSFKVDCPSDLDCRPGETCPPEALPAPEINYLAKDYASFRQLILDRLALTMPDWQERHIPDIGITLVEVLAYVADHLSYYQDAVATEAYLDTARQRISVRRHARLVDYRLHDGCNARAWVSVWTQTDLPPLKPQDFFFITGFTEIQSASGRVLNSDDLRDVPFYRYEAFEPLVLDPTRHLRFRAAHSEIRFYTWGDLECCLPRGATRATLLDQAVPQQIDPAVSVAPPEEYNEDDETGPAARQRLLTLQAGDVLIFEEVLGPTTNNAADADPRHRHAVRLTKVTPNVDPLFGVAVLEIEWALEDALPFPLCLSARLPAPDCDRIEHVSVARGNIILVDHGRTLGEPMAPVPAESSSGECACEGSVTESTVTAKTFRPVLEEAPLTFAEPLVPDAPAVRQTIQDPRQALPALVLQESIDEQTQAGGAHWLPRSDLLSSRHDARHFAVETDDDGRAHLRFGNHTLGRRPTAGVRFHADYRVGIGPSGNVGRDTIRYLVMRNMTLSTDAVLPRNPMAAQGGIAPELTAEAKLIAPQAYRSRRERAVTAADYAELAARSPKLQHAVAELRWTGSWYQARVAVDPVGKPEADAALLQQLDAGLFRYRRMGHDLCVLGANLVPLDVALEVCVLADYERGRVKAVLLDVFSDRRLIDGTLGLFHPDKLSFGNGVYVSQLVAQAVAVEGVETARLTRLRRLHEPERRGAVRTDVPDSGVLSLGPLEIPQLDNDPDFPENGKLELLLRGGR
jgi:hypothetical protein